MKLMVFDVGGTEIKYGMIDDDLTITHQGYVETPHDNFDHFAQNIQSVYEQFKDEVEGVAISIPGFVDTKTGFIAGGGALTYNWQQPVGQMLAKRLGCKVHLENDGKAAALAEHAYGSLKGCQNASVFIIGTGIGGGLILNNELVRGPHFTAGEFSGVCTEASKWESPEGYLASTCATSALLGMYKAATGKDEEIDGREFFRRYHEGDVICKSVLTQLCKNIAVQIYNLTILLDIEKIAIGGGISKQKAVVDTIKEQILELRETSFFTKVFGKPNFAEVVSCQFFNEANLIGAYYSYKHDL